MGATISDMSVMQHRRLPLEKSVLGANDRVISVLLSSSIMVLSSSNLQ